MPRIFARPRWLLAIAVVLAACSSNHESAAQSDMVQYEAPPPPASAPMEERSGQSESMGGARSMVDDRLSLVSQAHASEGSPEPSQTQAPKQARQLIYEATLSLAVRDPDANLRRAETLAQSVGGWVEKVEGLTITMRVPAAALQKTMADIESWGRVLLRDYVSTDVTAQVYDLETRIAVLRQTHAQLLQLLSRSVNVEEALAVRERLDKPIVSQAVTAGQRRRRRLDCRRECERPCGQLATRVVRPKTAPDVRLRLRD